MGEENKKIKKKDEEKKGLGRRNIKTMYKSLKKKSLSCKREK